MAPSTSSRATGLTALAAAASSSTTASGSGRNMADDDDDLDELLGINDHHGAPEVQEVAPTKDPIEDATLDDVEFIDEDANEAPLLVQKARGNQTEHRTKIKSILGKAVIKINRDVLQTFCQNNNVLTLEGRSCRTASKPHMCDRIIKYIEDPVGAKQFETPSTSKTDPTVNKVRLCNVLFGEIIKSKLHERAKNLTKDEMTMGFKNGQPVWEEVMKEYNIKTKYMFLNG
jgi:hypothetical protein